MKSIKRIREAIEKLRNSIADNNKEATMSIVASLHFHVDEIEKEIKQKSGQQ